MLPSTPSSGFVPSAGPSARPPRQPDTESLLVPGLEKETCLIPALSEQEPEFANSYNLVTENLVLTQYTLHLGFHR